MILSTLFNKSKLCSNFIRNEKVGCSIHLSGTNKIKKVRYLNRSGLFSPSTGLAPDRQATPYKDFGRVTRPEHHQDA
jgi:hypothetical protein